MARNPNKDPSITQANDASSIGNKRKMAKRAKRHSNKIDRQILKEELIQEIKNGLHKSDWKW